MSAYNPSPFPRRPKTSNPVTELLYHIHLAYYRYEINTALYVMSPGEKLAFNLTLISFLVLLLSAIYYYLPTAVLVSIQRLAYYFTGSSSSSGKLDVGAIKEAGAALGVVVPDGVLGGHLGRVGQVVGDAANGSAMFGA